VLLHALDWLQQRLASGPAPTTDLITEAKQQEISRRTLFRAKDRLGVQGGRQDYLGSVQYMWWLAEGVKCQKPNTATPET
jgi:hypothetical protein